MCIDHQGKDKELVVNGKTVHISNQQLEEEYFQIDEEITDEKLLRYRDFMFETAREQFGPKEEKRLRRIYEQMGLARFRKVVERSVGISSAVHDQLNKKIN
jgi:dissimilatory sulfite reductase (desulfoviridin) alpha/beta subunit